MKRSRRLFYDFGVRGISFCAVLVFVCASALTQTTQPTDSPEIKEKRERAKQIARTAFSLQRQSQNELRESIAKSEQAIALFAEIGDKEGEAEMLYEAADANMTLGANRKALELLRRAEVLMRGSDNADANAGIMMRTGIAYLNLGEMQTALAIHLRALELVKKEKDLAEAEPLAMILVGKVYFALGETSKAIEYYQSALELIDKSKRKRGKEDLLTLLGDAHLSLGETERAQSFYDRALQIYVETNSRVYESYMLAYIGNAYAAAGNRDQAVVNFNRALERIKGNTIGETIILNARGMYFQHAGDRLRARADLGTALEKAREAKNELLTSTVLSNLGMVETSIGESATAITNLTEAVKLAEKNGDKQMSGVALINLGFLYNSLGEHQKALECYRQALGLMETLENKKGQAFALNNIGLAHALMGEKDKAAEFYQRAQVLDKSFEEIELNNTGGLMLLSGDAAKAIERYAKAVEASRTSGNASGEAVSLQNLGAAYSQAGDQLKAVDSYNQAMALHRSSGDLRNQALVLNNLMISSRNLGRPRLAVFYGKQAVNTLQGLRSGIRSFDADIQKSFLSTFDFAYRNLAELLITQGRLSEAERVIRMLKDEEYFDFVNRDGSVAASLDERVGLTPSEKTAFDRYETVYAEADAARRKAEKLEIEKVTAPEDRRNAIAADLIQAKADVERSMSKLRDTAAQVTALLATPKIAETGAEKTEEKGASEILKTWNDPQTAVVSTVVGSNGLGIIVSTSKMQRGYVRPISEIKLKQMVDDLRAAITKSRFEKSDARPAAQALYDELIRPIEKNLEAANIRTIVWSLDKFLRYVPVSALWDEKKGYVVQRYASVVLALAGRQNLAFKPANKAQWKALGVGTSKGSGNLDALTNVPKELGAIVNDPTVKTATPGLIAGKRLLDDQFTLAEFRRSLGPAFPFTHAATHFVFISGTKAEGLNSYLLMGNGEKLTLSQIQNSDNIFSGVELLTLSACDTGYGGRTKDGREIEGLGVLAQRKGARAIMATLWPVDDESTRNLMVEFYRDYKKPGLSKAEALRKAQLAVLGEPDLAGNPPIGKRTAAVNAFANPYYWSPFILIGNWR